MHLYNKLVEYSKSEVYPMHMPGHKRNNKIGEMINPYEIDVTEIEGLDNLFHSEGILKEGMERAGFLYNSLHTDYLVGGSSAGILSGISACTNKGDKVLVARNCHKSVYNTIYLNELKPVYIYPQTEDKFGVHCGISPGEIEKLLIKHKDIKLIIITSPTYEGIISDIRGISEIAHKYKIPLFVDEAHGAHLGFNSYFPKNSIELGADIVVHSLHKTLPSFTQTGLLHVNGDLVDYEQIQYYLSVFQSSSPSYILMSSIDNCINLLINKKEELFIYYVKQLEVFYEKIEGLKHLKILTNKNTQSYDFDPSKIVVSTRATNMTGMDLYKLLLEEYKIQVEMVSKDYIIAMTSICDTDIGFSRLVKALLEIDGNIKDNKHVSNKKSYNSVLDIKTLYKDTEIIMTSYKAKKSPSETVSFKDSEGRISSEYIYLYPPGIPIIVPGERINSTHIDYLLHYKELGLSVQGLEDYDMNQINVVL